MAKIWKCRIDDDRYEIFAEEGMECYEDGSDCSGFEIFRAEEDDRIIGIGFYLCALINKKDMP